VLFTLLEKDLVGRLEAKCPADQHTEPFDHRPGHASCPSALLTIAFEIYSDATLTSAEVSHTAAPDPATVAVAHGHKHG
jgi:hypothetical protein